MSNIHRVTDSNSSWGHQVLMPVLDDFFHLGDLKARPWYHTALKIAAYILLFPIIVITYFIYKGLKQYYFKPVIDAESGGLPSAAYSMHSSVIPPVAPISRPLGIPNYGQSCWFTSPLQVLLASPHFDQAVSTSSIDHKNPEKNALIQQGFQQVRECQRRNDARGFFQAVKHLHNRCLNAQETNTILNKYPGLLNTAFSNYHHFEQGMCWDLIAIFTEIANDVTWLHESIYQPIYYVWRKDEDNPSRKQTVQRQSLSEFLIGRIDAASPNMIWFRGYQITLEKLNEILNTSYPVKCVGCEEEKMLYQIRGVVIYLAESNHYISYVRYGQQWFICNDGRIKNRDAAADQKYFKNARDVALLLDREGAIDKLGESLYTEE